MSKLKEVAERIKLGIEDFEVADGFIGGTKDEMMLSFIGMQLEAYANHKVKGYKKELREEIINQDSKYIGECCRKTANIYKEQFLNKLNH